MERVNRILAHPTFRAQLSQLEALEAQRSFCHHDLEHLLSVARLMAWYDHTSPQPLPQGLIYATALLHDIGRAAQYTDGTPHEAAGVAIAAPILADCGFSPEEQAQILSAIGAHRSPDAAQARLGALLYRADKKSRPCFACPAKR
jgi:HD superfamily phosphodiesterase